MSQCLLVKEIVHLNKPPYEKYDCDALCNLQAQLPL
jgi:hypothetical protein